MASMLQWIDTWFPVDLTGRMRAVPLRMEELRQDGSLTLRMEIPGIDPAQDVDVCVDDGVLTVSGQRTESSEGPRRSEFAYGRFLRMVTLPRGVDEDSMKASYHDGILEITMALAAREEALRHIPIDAKPARD